MFTSRTYPIATPTSIRFWWLIHFLFLECHTFRPSRRMSGVESTVRGLMQRNASRYQRWDCDGDGTAMGMGLRWDCNFLRAEAA